MKLCGKRLFTRECKAADRGLARRNADFKTGRFGFCRAAHFFWAWWRAFFRGVLGKKGVLLWCFCGEVVVDCVVNRGALMAGFWRLKKCHF